MPIGTGIIYNVGDLILSQVSSSGTAFLETKIAAATSSIVYFDNTARINSASLNSITVGTASYVSGSTSIITNLTASNISASGTGSFGMVGIGTTVPSAKLDVVGSAAISSTLTVTGTTALNGAVNLSLAGTPTVTLGASTTYGVLTATGTNAASIYLNGATRTGFEAKLQFGAAEHQWFNGSLSSQIMTLNTNGLGIGTTSPTNTLSLGDVGSIGQDINTMYVGSNFTGVGVNYRKTGNFALRQHFDSALGIIRFDNAVIGTSGSAISFNERMRIDSSGNVGIGTTSPAYLLDVSGSSRHGYRAVDTHQFTGSVSVSGSLNATASWATNALTASSLVAANSYTITNLTASNISASLTGSFGMVGIGTTSPTQKLHIVGAVYGTTNGQFGNAVITGTGTGFAVFGSNAGGTGVKINLDSDITRNDLVISASTGYVGIGTASPSTPLHVFNTAATLATFTRDLATDVGFSIGADSNGTVFSTAGAHAYQFYTNGTEKVRIISDGNVGIGTTSPSVKLAVEGGSIATVNITGSDVKLSFDIRTLVGGAIGFNNAAASNVYGAVTGSAYFGVAQSYPIVFTTAGTERMRIESGGNVGIGTTSPGQKLEVATTTSNTRVRINSTEVVATEYFRSGTGVWLVGSDSSNSFKIARASNFGTNDYLSINSATADVTFFDTALGARMTLNGTGLGIGTTLPAAKLHVQGNISGSSFTSSISNAVGFLGTSSWAQNVVSASFATTAQTANALNTGNSYTVGSLTSTTQIGGTTGTIQSLVTPGIYSNGLGTGNAIAISSNTTFANQGAWANLGLHQTTANANDLTAKVYLAIGGWYQNSGTGLPVYIGGGYTSNSSSVLSVVPSDTAGTGNVGIGTTAPAAKLEISGSSNSVLMNIKSPISGAILYVSGSGAVGIGTSNVGAYTLQVNGSFAATTKSFVIEHPTKAGKKLIYGSLESPYHGIRLTGRDTLVNGKCKIQLPDYMYKLILHDSVNIQLTGIKCNKTLYVDEINIPENYFTIAYDKAIFESYKDYDFFWDFTGIRTDVPELITEL